MVRGPRRRCLAIVHQASPQTGWLLRRSSWWYHADVLRRAGGDPALIDAEIAALEELRELEPEARWPVMFLLRLRASRGIDVADLHAELRRVDPAHAGMYGSSIPPGFGT